MTIEQLLVVAREHQQAGRVADAAEAFNQLGVALDGAGRIEDSRRAFAHAVALVPTTVTALTNLARANFLLGRLNEALPAAQAAVQHGPQSAMAWVALATILSRLNRPAEAADAYRSAIRLRPDNPDAHCNLGNALKDQGYIADAIAAYRAALAVDPDHRSAWSNLLLALHFDPTSTGESILAEHRAWAKVQADPFTHATVDFSNDRSPDRRLRIGYVSPDFRRHAVGAFMLPLLANHDRAAFEIFCYADVHQPDAMTNRLRVHADTWRFTATLTDEAVAEQIRADEIDILVDLALHSDGNRMLTFARKPAPVLASYLGYPSTTGLRAMDWRLTDRLLDDPARDGRFYSEHAAYLETTYWCYSEPIASAMISNPPMLAHEHITFGCVNNFGKVSDAALAAWAEILTQLPDSRLILHVQPGPHRQRALNACGDRVTFVQRQSLAKYFEQYNAIDIALDPFPYCGATTTLDALWMGVPVVSLAGETAVQRAGLSILSRIGLADLVAGDIDNYIGRAVELAGQRERIAELRRTLRQRMRASPLMDAAAFARDVERLYRMMWSTWVQRTG